MYEINFHNTNKVLVGRAESNDIVIYGDKSLQVSRVHLEFFVRHQVLYVRCLGSHGMIINGKVVQCGEIEVVRHKDIIKIINSDNPLPIKDIYDWLLGRNEIKLCSAAPSRESDRRAITEPQDCAINRNKDDFRTIGCPGSSVSACDVKEDQCIGNSQGKDCCANGSKGSYRKKTYFPELTSNKNKEKTSGGFWGKLKRMLFVGEEDSYSRNEVKTSVFAPAEAKRGDYMLVQVFLYTDEETNMVAQKAAVIDHNAELKNYSALNLSLNVGDKIQVGLSMLGEGLKIDEYEQEMEWHGHYTDCQFAVFVSDTYKASSVVGNVVLSVNGIPKARMKFQTIITYNPDHLFAKIENELFKKIFISYSHLDEDKVKYLAEGIKFTGVEYFFDRHYLKTGDIYPVKIQNFIATADLFVLCWSQNAASSDYVRKEYTQALNRISEQNSLGQDLLSIRPINIEPRAELPKKMRETFNFGIL